MVAKVTTLDLESFPLLKGCSPTTDLAITRQVDLRVAFDSGLLVFHESHLASV